MLAPHGNITLLGSQFKIDGSILGNTVAANPDKVDIQWKTFDIDPPEEPKIPENIIAASKDFVDKINSENVSISFIPYRQDANDSQGEAGFINPTEYNNSKDDELSNVINGITSNAKNPAHTYANLGDGLRRAYYILKKYPIYSKSVVVLSNGIIKGWTQQDTAGDVNSPPFKTLTGKAKKFGVSPDSDDSAKAYSYAEYFLKKLKSERVNSYLVQLNNIDTSSGEEPVLQKLVNATNGITGGETQYLTGSNSVPLQLTSSINKNDTKRVEKIDLRSVEIHEKYLEVMKIQNFDYTAGSNKSSGWIKDSDTSFTGYYQGNIGKISIDNNGTFNIPNESVASVVQFSESGLVTVGEDSLRYVKYKYIFMEKDQYIDDQGNDLGSNIDAITDDKYYKKETVPLNAMTIDVAPYSDHNIPDDPIISVGDMIVGDVAYVKLNLGSFCVVDPTKIDNVTKNVVPVDPEGKKHGDVYQIKEWQIVDKDGNIISTSKTDDTTAKLTSKYIDLIYDTNEPRLCKVVAKSTAKDVFISVKGKKLVQDLKGLAQDISDDVSFSINTDIN